MERYGPCYEQIEMLIAMCDQLDDEKMATIREAFLERGTDDARYAWRAAEHANRHTQTGAASWDAAVAVKLLGFDTDPDLIRWCSLAATDAGIAISTKDLVGKSGYTQGDYDRLVGPWFSGFNDSSLTEKESS